MYPNFIEDRKALDYEVHNDTSCGIKLVLITDSTVLLIRNLPPNVKRKTKRLIIVISLATVVYFNGLEPVEAIGMSIPPQQTVVMSNQDNVIMNFQKQPKIMMKSLSKPGQISLPISIYLMDERFLRTPEVNKLIKNLRGGGLTEAALFIALIGIIVFMASNSQGFVRPGTGVVPPHLA